jgi:UDP-N-acetylmuramate--alanine ligase
LIDLKNIQRLYFIGIGGIGMSALARYFSFHGKPVSGYDKTSTVLTRQLEQEGIAIVYDDQASLAPKDADLIVYTPAIPASHPQLNFYRENGYTVVKRSDVLGAITRTSFNICIAGTHGKTTISSMVAHILRDSGYGCNAFLGGITGNYNSNFWSSENNTCVIEADEYDRSFLKLSPDIAVISAMDADHLDIYGTEEAMRDAFEEFGRQMKPDGRLYVKKGIARESRFDRERRISYGITSKEADVYAFNISMENGHYVFDVNVKGELIESVNLNMGGLHNVENATVAIAIARQLAIDIAAVKKAVAGFKGVKRRFEYVVKNDSAVYIDDYAHHPEELSALINSAIKLFPDRHPTVIFQPHLFTRTRDFADEFAASLDVADDVLLLPIYPARELPIEGVNSEMIRDRMKYANTRIVSKEEALVAVKEKFRGERKPGLLITAGAGDIDTLVEPIKNILTR